MGYICTKQAFVVSLKFRFHRMSHFVLFQGFFFPLNLAALIGGRACARWVGVRSVHLGVLNTEPGFPVTFPNQEKNTAKLDTFKSTQK